jgi:hypothetical protein
MTIREQITALSDELQTVDQIGPQRASEALLKASSLLSSLNKHISEKLYALNVKKMHLLEEHKVVAKAKLISEASEEWLEWNQAANQKEALVSIIGSLKYYLKAAIEERQIARY